MTTHSETRVQVRLFEYRHDGRVLQVEAASPQFAAECLAAHLDLKLPEKLSSGWPSRITETGALYSVPLGCRAPEAVLR